MRLMPGRSASVAALLASGFASGSNGPSSPAPSPLNAASNEVIFGSDFEWPSPVGTGSVYLSIASDRFIAGNGSTLLSKTTYVPQDGWAYIQSDGRYFSAAMPTGGLARIRVMLDGAKVSNDSTIDWTGGTHVSQHCFNAVAAVYLLQGYHDVSLVAEGQSYFVGAGSHLSLLANAASSVEMSTLAADGGPYSFSLPGSGLPEGALLPYYTVLSQSVSSAPGQPIISVTSFSETNAGRNGDALASIYKDGVQPTLAQATWTDNDAYPAIELRAPMYGHAYFETNGGWSTVSLSATLYPWSRNGYADDVTYSVDEGAKLISLIGGMTVFGKAPSLFNFPQSESHFGAFRCVGTSQAWPTCPQVDTEVKLASATFTVPPSHSGEVFFTSKVRMQGDVSDGGGNVFVFLKIDGQNVGTYGVQGITAFDGESQRTLSTSYFTAGDRRLVPGIHTVEAFAKASGAFVHMTVSADLPLIFFD